MTDVGGESGDCGIWSPSEDNILRKEKSTMITSAHRACKMGTSTDCRIQKTGGLGMEL